MAEATSLEQSSHPPRPHDQRASHDRYDRAVPGPFGLPDHEAFLRPCDHAGALTDPEQADRKSDEAGEEEQGSHGRIRERESSSGLTGGPMFGVERCTATDGPVKPDRDDV